MAANQQAPTLQAVRRYSSMTVDGSLPRWMFSPETPDKPEPLLAANGEPPADGSTVVDCGGALWDRIVLYRPHAHTLRLPSDVSPLLRTFFAIWWEKHEDDSRPENRDERARILAMASEVGGGAEFDRRRAWRVIDWQVRVHAPAILSLAGFDAHAQAYRDLPEIVGPDLPRETVRAFRAAHRETDKASTAAAKQSYERRRSYCPSPAWHLERAVRHAFPRIDATLKETYPSKMAPLGLGLLAKGYARIVIERVDRLSPAALRRTRAQLEAGADALVREVVTMQSARRRAAA